MGVMIEGRFSAEDPGPSTDEHGRFVRAKAPLTEAPPGDAAPGDLHLFAAWNCPWAHRVLLTRAILGLDEMTVSYALPRRTEQGWVFAEEPLLRATAMHEVYAAGVDAYTGRITVPVLWHKPSGRALNNESAEIVRMLGDLFAPGRLVPDDKRAEIDEWNDLIHRAVNNGVYRAGFAETQEAYEEAAREVFAALDQIDEKLGRTRYLTGDALTEADIRLFPTLVRFDVAYHGAFKCNLKRLIDYPNLWPYARDLYQTPGAAETVRFDIYKAGYYSPSPKRNPLGIVPIGPEVDWTAPHGRA
ncbi:MAG: glutathione S-transferase C-terminal domain-containing protein [Pseudomonadota bacterium]